MASANRRDIGVDPQERVVPAGANRHGLVIGIETYQNARLNLRCARKDAEAMHALMTDPSCGLFPPENVTLLVNRDATTQAVRKAFSALWKRAGEADTVWVYYAGHGAQEGRDTYWVTHDADVDDLYATGIRNAEIVETLGRIQAARVVVFLDCCHAAATAVQRNPQRKRLTAETAFAAYEGKGQLTISSSNGDEKSVELGDRGHGAFTYFLTQGLRGEADADKDGIVTADELWSYLHGKVRDASRQVGNPQTPIFKGELSHDLALTLNPNSNIREERIRAAIERNCGLGSDKLSTNEGEFCIELLSRGPRTQEERHVVEKFDAIAAGMISVRDLKKLVKDAMPSAPPPPPPMPQAEAKRIVRAAAQQFVSKRQTWNHAQWLEFLADVRQQVPTAAMSDTDVGTLLEAESLRRKHEEAERALIEEAEREFAKQERAKERRRKARIKKEQDDATRAARELEERMAKDQQAETERAAEELVSKQEEADRLKARLGVRARLGATLDEAKSKSWVWRPDAAQASAVEPAKGDEEEKAADERAAVQSRRDESWRRDRIASLLAIAQGMDNAVTAADGIAFLDELLSIDPAHGQAIELKAKLVRLRDSGFSQPASAEQFAIEPSHSRERNTELTATLLAKPMDERRAGEVLVLSSVEITLAWIPPGEFMMGSPTDESGRCPEETLHRVRLTKGFWIGTTPVTQAQWKRVMGSAPSHFKGAELPVENVSWEDCQQFCTQLGQLEGKKVRLPTEAEWEYACRAGTTTPFFFGQTILADQANFDGNRNTYESGKVGIFRQKTTPVTTFPPNSWGLYDMHGNVWEWCADWAGPYPAGDTTDPTGPATGESRALRGGSWDFVSQYCRAACRLWDSPHIRVNDFGFRLALDV
jgi:formylglycine-generating enzyme required for sulfatase activity